MSQAASSQATARRVGGRIGALQIAIIALVIITALIHLQRAFGMMGGGPGGGQGGPPPGAGGGGFNIMQALPLPLPYMFLLNGIGYLVLVTALYLPALARYRELVRWLLIAFAAVTIVLYFAIAGLRFNPIGLFDKAVEVALIVLLLIDRRQSQRSAIDAAPA
jgi:hypothetical protein